MIRDLPPGFPAWSQTSYLCRRGGINERSWGFGSQSHGIEEGRNPPDRGSAMDSDVYGERAGRLPSARGRRMNDIPPVR